jgi:hypothetical protein
MKNQRDKQVRIQATPNSTGAQAVNSRAPTRIRFEACLRREFPRSQAVAETQPFARSFAKSRGGIGT